MPYSRTKKPIKVQLSWATIIFFVKSGPHNIGVRISHLITRNTGQWQQHVLGKGFLDPPLFSTLIYTLSRETNK
jgi:hypothetical protein